jgi:hypothetical protein
MYTILQYSIAKMRYTLAGFELESSVPNAEGIPLRHGTRGQFLTTWFALRGEVCP